MDFTNITVMVNVFVNKCVKRILSSNECEQHDLAVQSFNLVMKQFEECVAKNDILRNQWVHLTQAQRIELADKLGIDLYLIEELK